MDFSAFILKHVGEAEVKPLRVLMKMDVEGSEYSVLPHMLSSGSFHHIDMMTFEFHRRFCPIKFQQTRGLLEFSMEDCLAFESMFPALLRSEYKTEIHAIDDEKHRNDGRPLP